MSEKKSARISITVSPEELERWGKFNHEPSLSAFIRKAVNEYIQVQDPDRTQSILEIFLAQQTGMREIKTSLSKIEDDLFEITASLAQQDILPDPERKILDQRLVNYLTEQIGREDTSERKITLEKMKAQLQKNH